MINNQVNVFQKEDNRNFAAFAEKRCSFPACPYMQLRCLKYNPILKYAVCVSQCGRCCWLPSWVSDGYHVAKLRGGRLYV